MKKGLLLVSFILASLNAFGQLETWELSASAGNQASNNASTVGTGINTGILQRGAGVAASAAGGSISSSGWFNTNGVATTLADAIANNEYYEFTLPIQTCYKADITTVQIVLRSSNTGPNTATLRSSIDGFTANLGTATVTAASVLNTFNVNLNNNSGTVTFRLYGYGNAVSGTPNTGGTMRIGTSVVAADNDLIINGSTTAQPSAAVLSGSGGPFCASGTVNLQFAITGGTGPYSVVYSDGTNNFTVNNYTSGANIPHIVTTTTTFTPVSVTDANGCSAPTLSGSFTVQVSPNNISITESITQPSCNAPNGGAINITPAGGIAPYTYSWAGTGVNPTAEDQTGLSAGTYTVTVTGVGGCTASKTYMLNAPTGCGIIITPGSIAACYPTAIAAEEAALLATSATTSCIPPVLVLTASSTGTCSAEVTVTVTDACGNSAFTVYNTRIDNTAPVVTAGSIAACYPSAAAAEAAAIAATTATDNCPGILTYTASTTGTCNAVVKVTVKDECGKSASVNYNTRVDGTAPTFIGLPASPITVNCNEPVPPVANVTATDDCGPVTPQFSTSTTPGNCPQERTITRTWTATDACGNNTSFTQTINVVDDSAPVFNQSPLPANITVSCSDIPMPETLDGTDNCDPGIPVPVIFINEIHYDNAGTDAGEFIEIAGTAGIDLSGYQLVLYNGTGGAPYGTTVLSGIIDNEAGGFGAVSFAYPANGIQNGAPDGVALATTSGMVIQFLSYEGTFVAVGGVANGMMSTAIPVLEDGTNAVGTSIQLTGTGQQYGDFTWVGPIAASAGTLNVGQTINPLPGVIPAMFSQMIQAGNCNGESIITRMWQLKDVCGNSITHTQVITVDDAQGPSFSPPPLPVDITIECDDPVPAAPTLTAADLCDVPGMMTERVWINEIHYDNAGADAGEFIEVAGTAGTDLSTYSLVLYNGSNGLQYGTTVINGIIPNQANGFGTVCVNYAVNGIQNGAPDGVALVHNVMGGMVVQFLSYEGTFTAADGPANGMLSTAIPVLEDGTNAAGTSIYLTGNGDEYTDFTWAGPAAATNCGVNTGQTFISMSMGPTVTFSETQEPGACPQERFIYRTWTATDACGNATTLNQTITIEDNTAPTLVCPAGLTLNLDAFGNASIDPNDINYTVSDNCAPVNTLVELPLPAVFFDCDDEGQVRPVVVQVQDPCSNVGSCTVNVLISPYSRCTPVILITDPCVCKNNATTLTNGQFGETIKIESLAGKTWSIFTNTGLYSAGSPQPPLAPTPLPAGTQFVESPPNSGDYYLTGIHIDALGYNITVRSETGQLLSIGNSCQYPNPAITADLNGPFCLYSDPVTLTGTPGDGNIVSEGFTINGVPATVFDPAQGVGEYHIVYTVNGGVPKAFGPNDPGCIQSVEAFVNVLPTPTNLVCNDHLYISLDADCTEEILPDDILEGTYGCFDDYIVEIDRTVPFGNGPWTPGVVDVNDIGKTWQVRVSHLVSGNKCWGLITVEDKLPPQVDCEDIHLNCAITTYTPEYIQNILHINAGEPTVTDCQSTDLSYVDTWYDLDCNQSINGQTDISAYVKRVWTAVDASGNTADCVQYIYFDRIHIYDLTFPDEAEVSCTSGNTDPLVTGVPYYTAFGINWPLYPEWGFCELAVTYSDDVIPVCDGTTKILRTWKAVDWCLPTSPLPPLYNPLFYIQVIKVADHDGPAMTCPANMTVSVNPFQCCATVDLPSIIVEDACSRINNVSGIIRTFDPQTNQQTGIYAVGGTLEDFPGNNWWDRDTMANFGWTPCLPVGTQTVTLTAQDDCSNTKTCSFRLVVEDQIPPVAACDQFTIVALSVNGEAEVNASTFDDGSYDNCCLEEFAARRMTGNGCGGTSFGETVTFCCNDIGETIMVAFRVTDCSGNTNECMVQVEVQDKVKPVCVAPSNVTVNCENFDPSLWTYGIPLVEDNCCLDDSKVYLGQEGLTHSVSYAQFDTVCNRGTIVRTFRAFDCHGLSGQCTQRIVVNYLQDYYVKFPDDQVILECNGSGIYGTPTFFGEDCELLGVSYADQIFTVVPDACFKIERTWNIINWCTFDPNQPLIFVPNPNPNATTNHPSNRPGPTVSACGTIAPWAPTVVKINPNDPTTTNYCTFWNANANGYSYKQIIKIIDNQPPTGRVALPDCDNQSWNTTNNGQLWNEPYWWDNSIGTHNLCEEPTNLCITGTDSCSGSNINIEYLLFLDLDGDGTMETVVNSVNTGIAGLGWNNVQYNNLNTPSYSGGTPRAFDERPVPANQKYGFAIQETVSGMNKTACVRWNTQQQQNNYVNPELPHGTHKIKWFITDGCGNGKEYEYSFTVKDCKAPTVVCLNGLSANIMPTGMITLWASDFLQYTEDNCTPAGQIKIAIRKCGEGTGFPTNPDGTPQTSVTFTCDDEGQTKCVELWAMDAAGNADRCETYVIVQDNLGNCNNIAMINVGGTLKTENSEGVEEGNVMIDGTSNFTPPFTYFDLSDDQGKFAVMGNVPLSSNFSVVPEKDDNPLNGVTTYDLVLISKHILATEPLSTTYKMIAADANKSGSITTFDIVEIRKLILGIYTELPNNTSWRFVDKSFVFPNLENPFETPFPETKSVAGAFSDCMDENFVGVKIGDVNNSAAPNLNVSGEERSTGVSLFDLEDRRVNAGETFELSFKAAEALEGFQFTLKLNGLEALGVTETEHVNATNFNMSQAGLVAVSIDGAQGFTLRLRATREGRLSEMLGVSGAITRAEAYSREGRKGVALRFDGKTITGPGFELYQNVPNPFVSKTFIGFNLPEAAEATLSVFDETGRVVYRQKGQFAKGENAIQLDRALINTTGMLYYTLETATDSATRKMIQAR